MLPVALLYLGADYSDSKRIQHSPARITRKGVSNNTGEAEFTQQMQQPLFQMSEVRTESVSKYLQLSPARSDAKYPKNVPAFAAARLKANRCTQYGVDGLWPT
ncbi:hypothetical protein ACMYSQ_009662 [Aspergillus niger]